MLNNYVLTYGLIPFIPIFFYLDREPYVADHIFVKHGLRVHFRGDFKNKEFPYDVVTCWVWPWQIERFEDCMCELYAELSKEEDFAMACDCFQMMVADAQ